MNESPHRRAVGSLTIRELVAREQALSRRALLAQSVGPRYLMMAVGAAVAVVTSIARLLVVPLWVVLAIPAAVAFANFCLDRAARRSRASAAYDFFWVVVALDGLGIAASTVVLGRYGYFCLAFYLAAVGGYALVSLAASRVALAIACVAYPLGRVLGTRLATGIPLDLPTVAGETVMLAGFGWLAMRAPARQARRVHRARLALAELEHGAFDVRLPARATDDLGYLAASFNRTAEALGNAVAALRGEIIERERAEAALRVGEARLVAAEREARTMAARMHAVAVAAAAVLAADSEDELQRVLGEACARVMPFDAFTFRTYDRDVSLLHAADGAPPADGPDAAWVDRLCAEVARTRRSQVAQHRGAAGDAPGQGSSMGSAVCSPVLDAGTVLGVITVRSDAPAVYGDDDVVVLEAVAALAATALRNVRLVEELRGSREALAHQAYHDPLTGLVNRARFGDRLAQVLASRHAASAAVLVLDLDGFKAVNDSLGHAAGDALLVRVAARLLDATRDGDTVARLGGDEFAVLIVHADDEVATAVADRILGALHGPIHVGDGEVNVGASIGVARAREGDTPEDLLRHADVAMYRAKASGKGKQQLFAPAMYEAVRDRLALEGELRAAIARDEFHVVYQPIVELDGAGIVGVEALVRWAHPTRGAVTPAEFIPLAELTGLILPLGRRVLREACRRAAAWRRARMARGGARPVYVAVNISGRQLQDPNLIADVAAALDEAGLEPAGLLLEITESVIMHDTESSLATLHALKALGVRLAIDDFGTGYSSLAYLQRFPVDVLKIDKSFVDGMARGGNGAALARTIIALGETLGLQTVAEGVEEPDQRAHLRALGCELAQGYLFARPLAPADAEALVLGPADPAAVSGD